MLSQTLWVTGVLFLAALTQSATGFGLALVSMPLLSLRLPLPQATALVATVSMAVEIAILWRYWAHLRWGPVLRLVLASLAGIPVGVTLLRRWPERWLLAGLGVVLAGYALYAWLGWRLPRLRAWFWPWLMGFLAGALGGAYNTSGPPVILYGHAREWPPAEFKASGGRTYRPGHLAARGLGRAGPGPGPVGRRTAGCLALPRPLSSAGVGRSACPGWAAAVDGDRRRVSVAFCAILRAMDLLTGAVERITFHNAENGYTVLRLRPDRRVPGLSREGLVTVASTSTRAPPGKLGGGNRVARRASPCAPRVSRPAAC